MSEIKKRRYQQVSEEWEAGTSIKDIAIKFHISESMAKRDLLLARLKEQEKNKKKEESKSVDYQEVAEEWNEENSKEKIDEEFNTSQEEVDKTLHYTGSNRIEGKVEKKPRYEQVTEEYNTGLSKEEIAKKFNINENTVYHYLFYARKKGIEVTERKQLRYEQVAEKWNAGISEEEIAKKLNISEAAVNDALNYARRKGIKLKERKQTQYEQVAEEWNSGLSREEIAKKLNITKSEVNRYLSYAKRKGIVVTKVAQNEQGTEESNSNNNLKEKDYSLKIKEMLKKYMPLETAKKLHISAETVFNTIDSLDQNEEKEIKKGFLQSRSLTYNRIVEMRKKGLELGQIFRTLEKDSVNTLFELADIYYALENSKRAIKLLKTVVDSNGSNNNNKRKAKDKIECIKAEVNAIEIREEYKKSKEEGTEISYDYLCKKYNVRESFLNSILGRQAKDIND